MGSVAYNPPRRQYISGISSNHIIPYRFSYYIMPFSDYMIFSTPGTKFTSYFFILHHIISISRPISYPISCPFPFLITSGPGYHGQNGVLAGTIQLIHFRTVMELGLQQLSSRAPFCMEKMGGNLISDSKTYMGSKKALKLRTFCLNKNNHLLKKL